MLSLQTSDGSCPEDAQKLALFKIALQEFVGHRPFHNFAGDRKQYVKADKGSAAMIQRYKDQQAEREEAAAVAVAAAAAASSIDDEEQQQQQQQQQQQRGGVGGVVDASMTATETAGSSGDGTMSAGEVEGEGGGDGEGRQWIQVPRWLEFPDPSDPVVKAHYRRVLSFEADDPQPLVPGALLSWWGWGWGWG